MIPSFSDVRARQFGWALAISTLVGSLVAGQQLGLEVAILVLAAGSLVLVISLLWASVAGLSGDTPLTLDEAIGMGAPSAEEEQKRSVLRALKDLEYERSVGKLTEADYREFSERYRADARRLIEAVDSTLGPAHELAEKLARERLERAGLLETPAAELATPGATAAAETKPGPDAAADDASAHEARDQAKEPTKPKPAKTAEAELAEAVRQESES